MIFFTSDTHFNHANIINLGVGRPFKDIDHHNATLIRNWNSVVDADDTVYHLGDVALGPWPTGLDMVGQLNGFKILVPGNHDRISSVESVARRNRFFVDYTKVFQQINAEVCAINIGGHDVILSHYPYDGDNEDGREDRHKSIRAVDFGIPLIHGHTHSQSISSYSKRGSLQISVGVDSNDWTPVPETRIISMLKHLKNVSG